MSINKRPWPLKTTHGIRDRINTNPDYQRPAVWGRSQKQLLIDTILREYDIPKLYWRKVNSKPDKYDVVDGQQRLRAIWEYIDGQFKLPKDCELVDGENISNCTYEELPDTLRMQFDVYSLDVVILEEMDEDEVREMFLRLQNGTSLKAQEKRNAYPGRMRDFVKSIAAHKFFDSVKFANSRYTHDLIAAQLIRLELAAQPVNIKNADLNKMYEDYIHFDESSSEAKRVRRTLSVLADIFPEKTPELERYNVISLYCVISELLERYVIEEIQDELNTWFIDFESERRIQESKSQDNANSEWISYRERVSHSTDSGDSIRFRVDFLLGHLLESYPSLSLKDNQREFTYAQRLAIYRRDNRHCQLKIQCTGDKLTWDNWHCDHTIPWSKGGKTTVKNGKAACPACNLAKGAS